MGGNYSSRLTANIRKENEIKIINLCAKKGKLIMTHWWKFCQYIQEGNLENNGYSVNNSEVICQFSHGDSNMKMVKSKSLGSSKRRNQIIRLLLAGVVLAIGLAMRAKSDRLANWFIQQMC